MTKQGTKTAVPRLRFPEFRGLEPWSPRPLIGLADKRVKWSFSGGPFGSNLKASDYASRGVRIIQLQNIGDGEFLSDYKIYTSTSKADELQSCNIYPGEILLSKMGDPVGRACIVPESESRYVMCSDGIRLVVDTKQFSRDFVFFAINFDSFRRRVEAVSTGSTRKRIGLDVLKQLPLDVPQLAEQQKVANCLRSLDEVIAAQGRKVEALKTHKRGLMQQLFPREGETRPRLRFPEFRDAPEWEKKQLAELGEIITGKTPSTSNAGLWGGGILFITPTDIDDSGKYQDTSQRTVVATSALKVLPVGSIAYTCIASIGKLAITVRPSVTNQQINSVITRPSIDNEFVYYALVHLTPWIKSIPATSTLPIINKTEFSAIEIGIPSDSLEQKAVADCLSSLDTRITAETARLAALKTHKQGLMQQLFPAPEAATA